MEFTDIQFKENVYDYDNLTVKYDKPVVVDFVTDWCSACKSTAPTLELAALKYSNSIDFIKVDVTKADALVTALGIQGVPTIVFYKPGESLPTKTHVGAMNTKQLEDAITSSFL